MLFTMQFLFPEPIKKSGFEGNVMFAVTYSKSRQRGWTELATTAAPLLLDSYVTICLPTSPIIKQLLSITNKKWSTEVSGHMMTDWKLKLVINLSWKSRCIEYICTLSTVNDDGNHRAAGVLPTNPYYHRTPSPSSSQSLGGRPVVWHPLGWGQFAKGVNW